MSFRNTILKIISEKPGFRAVIDSFSNSNSINIRGLNGSAVSVFTDVLSAESDKSILLITASDNDAKGFHSDLVSLGVEYAFYYPSINIMPYNRSVVNEEVESSRIDVIKRLVNGEKIIVCTSLQASVGQITPIHAIAPFYLDISEGIKIDVEKLKGDLNRAGYRRTQSVNDPGEFSMRGGIIDIYYSPHKRPVRIDLFDDIVETIKHFDPDTQKSSESIKSIFIPPYKEILYGETEIKRASVLIDKIGGSVENRTAILEKIKNFSRFDGEYFLISLFYEKYSITDYFLDQIIIINDSVMCGKRYKTIISEYEENYHLPFNRDIPRFTKEDILFDYDLLNDNAASLINVESFNSSDEIVIDFGFKGIPVYLGNLELFRKDLEKYLDDGYKIVLFGGNKVQQERLISLFSGFNPIDDRFEFVKNGFSVYSTPLSYGFISDEDKLFFLNDYELFGKRKISQHYYSRRTEQIDSFIDINPGDYVVHIHHGIGLYQGIERMKSLGVEKDYIRVLYADNEKLFIPVEQLNFIQKYISSGISEPKLDKLGGKGWNSTRVKVQKSIEELARELVKIYAYRLNQKGFAFAPDTPWQREFEAAFPYDETEDQLLSIEEVKRDMESDRPMDRLICGDVGFGKTEVAIRAAFKAVMSGKQVAILVPTTILAEQHYENMEERMKNYPVKIEMLSRFRSEQEQTQIIGKLALGEVDIIVGTHRLLSNDIKYKNLGLLIIDEEHKFGVKHKEKIKKFRISVDSLSMTATPIPRTLHMSLAKIRDMSVINTPPKDRQPVETFVSEYNEEIIIDAVERELKRDGQVFFLYNRVQTIYTMRNHLQKILPKARIEVAHGQMEENELEDVIHNFINHKFDILLTTTIIESGIDIPRANTIIIDRADKFGLASLYQLRGRVGRSDKQGYAYLFYSEDIALTEVAMKRLRVISEYTDLGSGFKVAMKDLEIRGAGNLFGPEQSGNILAVGFHLYCKLLQQAVNEIAKAEGESDIIESNEVYIDMKYNGFIPDDYIPDQKTKIEFYKKIAGVIHNDEIGEIKRLLEDRYGKIPSEVLTLFYLSEIRVICKKLKVTDVIERNGVVEVKFGEIKQFDVIKFMNFINKRAKYVSIKPDKPESLFVKTGEGENLKDKGELLTGMLLEFDKSICEK